MPGYPVEDEKRILLVVTNFILLFFILLFWLFPEFKFPSHHSVPELDVTIQVADIPPTRQEPPRQARPARPTLPIFIPLPVETEELPEKLPVDSPFASYANKQMEGSSSWFQPEVPARPLVDFVPHFQNIHCTGQIKLLLLISKLGKVEDVQLVSSEAMSSECIQAILKAARRSRWIPAMFQGQYVDCWVVKTYRIQKP